MKLNIVGAAYALWLLAIEIVYYQVHGTDQNVMEMVVLAGAVPVFLQLLLLGINPYGLTSPARLALIFLLIALLSYIFNAGDWNSFLYIVELTYLFILTIIVAGCPDRRLLQVIAIVYTVPSAVFLLYVDFTGKYLWGRLAANDIEANVWGLMGIGLAVMAFAHRSRLVGGFCVVAGLMTMYYASSRSSIFGFAVALMAVGICYAPMLRGTRLVATLGVIAGLLLLWIVFNPLLTSTVPAAINDLMKIDDPYRGAGTGATGRSEIWQEALGLWKQSPIVGVGFRQHETYLANRVSAHNAYIAMLADTGVVGLVWYLGLLGAALLASFKTSEVRTRNLLVATVVGYAAIGLFERRAINGGNTFSIYFLMCCFYALAQWRWNRVWDAYAKFALAAPRRSEAGG